MDRQEAIAAATEAGFRACKEMFAKLDLTEDEITEAFWVAAAATDAAKNMLVYRIALQGLNIRLDLTVAAGIAGALAGLNKRDEILKQKGFTL